MWTKTRCSSERPLDAPGHRAAGHRRRAAAFTLVELLVVVAIIALLLSIMVPSLAGARDQAKAAVCASQLRGLGTGLTNYTAEFEGWLPGMNTSGAALRAKMLVMQGNPDCLRDPRVPVQPHDWATPIFNLEMDLPRTRAERLRLVTEKFKCPAQEPIKSVLYPSDAFGMLDGSKVPDASDFFTHASWTGPSYLMPAHFQYWGKNFAKVNLAWVEGYPQPTPVLPKTTPSDWEAQYDRYVSHMDYVGTPSRKVFLADGTRYLTESGILDHDVSPIPDVFGSFTSSGAWWSGSTAYGVDVRSVNWDGETVARGSPSRGQNLVLSYRHCTRRKKLNTTCGDNPGAINAVFFDGHVELLNDQRSRRIDYWYPTGAVVQPGAQGMTRVSSGYVVP